MRNFLKRLKHKPCLHADADLIRWHRIHENGMEPRTVEAEYQCSTCGKHIVLHIINREECLQWELAMGHYKEYAMEESEVHNG